MIREININTFFIPRFTFRSSLCRVDGIRWAFNSHGDEEEEKELVTNKNYGGDLLQTLWIKMFALIPWKKDVKNDFAGIFHTL